MKKLIFSVISMIAFSSASFANTITDEENVVGNFSKEISMTFSCSLLVKPIHVQPVFNDILGGSCARVWGTTRIYALNAGATVQEADFIANGAWMACVGAI